MLHEIIVRVEVVNILECIEQGQPIDRAVHVLPVAVASIIKTIIGCCLCHQHHHRHLGWPVVPAGRRLFSGFSTEGLGSQESSLSWESTPLDQSEALGHARPCPHFSAHLLSSQTRENHHGVHVARHPGMRPASHPHTPWQGLSSLPLEMSKIYWSSGHLEGNIILP